MTWPFENDTSAITNKLAKRSRKADKRSKAFFAPYEASPKYPPFPRIVIYFGS